MFTNNYINFQKARFTAKSYNTTAKLTNADGTTVNAYAAMFFAADIGYWMTKAKCKAMQAYNGSTLITNDFYQGVFFGTGQTPANRADYKLESPIESGLTITNPSDLTWEEDGNGKYTAYADYVVRNTTDAEINIYEIGVFTPVSGQGTTPSSSTRVDYVLMERTVLTEPITIAPGESKLVTYKLTFNQTLNVE